MPEASVANLISLSSHIENNSNKYNQSTFHFAKCYNDNALKLNSLKCVMRFHWIELNRIEWKKNCIIIESAFHAKDGDNEGCHRDDEDDAKKNENIFLFWKINTIYSGNWKHV